MLRSVKQGTYTVLENSSSRPGRRFAFFITILILLNVIAVMLETIPGLSVAWETWLFRFEVFSVFVFSIEYVLRLWVCSLNPKYSNGVTGRIKYALSPLCLIDLIAIAPFYIPIAFTLDLRVLRIIRLVRFIRLIKIARYTEALNLITRVVRGKREELLMVFLACAILLIFSSTLLYYVEHDAQPKSFSSIPASLWWGIVTVTTVGYGDVFPITVAGKIITSVFALIGIALFALPAGIFAAGFSEEISNKKQVTKTCPHCGAELPKT
jgi:voltage-gated potassium channel